ncbi:MAG: phosphotransferase [Legionellales bacterium]|nr:phosphotransferase [Legionellales bacterium]
MTNEIQIDVALVQQLIVAQFPQWADLLIKPVEFGGCDNRTFRLGREMSIRLPSAEEYVRQVKKEQEWLPKIAPHLPLPIPQPLAMGMPSEDYPWHWSIYKWLEGESANSLELDDAYLEIIAVQLSQFLRAFHQFDAAGAPAPGLHNWWRAAHTSVYDAETRSLIETLKDFIDVDNAISLWQRAINSQWDSEPVWVHGDVASGNLLVKDNRLAAVIDFGCMGIGDPACDLTIAWTFFRGESRNIFKANLHFDEETWARARGWAMWKALYEISELEEKSGTELAKQMQIIDAVIEEDRATRRGHSKDDDHPLGLPIEYQQMPEYFDASNVNEETEAKNAVIHRLLKEQKVRTVLDMTCGTGSQVFYLVERGYEVIGNDFSPALIDIARDKAKKMNRNITFIKGDMRHVKIGKFDAVISIFNAIGHLTKADFEVAVKNICVNLKDNGVYIWFFRNCRGASNSPSALLSLSI